MSRLHLSAALLYQYTQSKLKPTVAGVALVAVSLFGGTAQAELIQLTFSGASSSGLLFFNTLSAPYDFLGTGSLYYRGTTDFSNPVTRNGHVTGLAYLAYDKPSDPFYEIRLVNIPSYAIIEIYHVPSPSTNLLKDTLDSFAGAPAIMKFWNRDTSFVEVGTISLPALTPPPVSAVPEPASWAMLLLGVGFIGGAVRYRRRQAVTASTHYRFS